MSRESNSNTRPKYSLDEIKDYLYCPKLYKLIHIDKLSPSKDANITNLFNSSLDKTISFFFYSIQEGVVPPISLLRNKYGNLYLGKRTLEQTMFLNTSWRNIARTLELKGSKMLHHFYDKFSKEHGVPIMVNKPYELVFDNCIVTGYIPLIRENTDKEIELVMFDLNTLIKKDINLMLKYNIDIIASSLAFRKIYNKDIKYSCYNLYRNDFIQMNSNIDSDNYKDFEDTVNSVGRAIQSNMFHSVFNSNCINCAYNKTCIRI